MKRLAIKVGQYEKEGKTKGEYVNLGVVLSNDNGEFMIIDPAVSLSGCLAKQNIMNHKAGKKISVGVLVSIFNDSNQQHEQNNQHTNNGFQDDIPF